MPYVSQLGTGQQVYLDNQGDNTIFTIVSSSPGQQQQASNTFTTGPWTSPPEILQTPSSIMVKIYTAKGEQTLQVHGNNMSMVNANLNNTQKLRIQEIDSMPRPIMSPMKPMEPMKPMKMNTTKRFCSQCGAQVEQSDRFCSSCGFNLN
ncbi:zinc ribbon domain-containing protein [Gloeocapsa sp. PCC 73106]|uniref:zinc ribbon domain-containing protein n=1 Tax=Gloeocapsa sp. PCC 73106 TaxID=102232 RepID=UPI0002ABAC42|nr:zinc ribbon domain-containing protein [Gloeocapsa sp. PCC 73106]ELR96380.1 hypothetical protein GLO73106DRAFT_00001720 [Gloeocapsa sp. PCC 73106]